MATGRMLILLVGPLLFALITLLVQRRWPVAAAIIGGSAVLFMGLLAPVGTSGEPIQLFGGGLSLTEQAASLLRLLYAAAALLFFLSARWPQGSRFVPAGLGVLALMAATVMIQTFSFGVVTLLAAVALLTVMVQANRQGSTLASLRYLTMAALALPFLLVAAWMLGSEQPALTASVWRLLLAGAALLLAGFPFHIWVRPVVDDAPPLVTVFLFTLAPAVTVFLLFNLLQQYPVVVQETTFPVVLRWSGALAAVTGGLLALNAGALRSLWGCLLLVELGGVLMLVAAGPVGQQAVFAGLGLRFATLLVGAVGLTLLEMDPEPGEQSAGASRRKRWAWVLFGYGALSLVGLPLTPGFLARWPAVTASFWPVAGRASLWPAAFLLIGMALAAAGLLRLLATTLQTGTRERPHVSAR